MCGVSYSPNMLIEYLSLPSHLMYDVKVLCAVSHIHQFVWFSKLLVARFGSIDFGSGICTGGSVQHGE